MALSPELQAKLMAYCHIDFLGPGEDELLEEIYKAARSTIYSAGPDGLWSEDAFHLCIYALVLDAWDRRSATVNAAVIENPAFRRRLNQLKMTTFIEHASRYGY